MPNPKGVNLPLEEWKEAVALKSRRLLLLTIPLGGDPMPTPKGVNLQPGQKAWLNLTNPKGLDPTAPSTRIGITWTCDCGTEINRTTSPNTDLTGHCPNCQQPYHLKVGNPTRTEGT